MIDSSEDLQEKVNDVLQSEEETKINSTLEAENVKINETNEDTINSNQLENSNKTEEESLVSQFESNNNLNSNPTSKFYDDLRTVIKTQENILITTSMAKEKIRYANEISVDQLKNFKESSLKYGKYLKMIHEELAQVGDLMKKIKKEIK